MLELAFALSAAAVTVGAADGNDKPPTVFVKDSARAARLDVEDERTVICVRQRLTGSRTRYEKLCMTSGQWKSFEVEKQAQQQDRNVSKPIETR